MNGSRARKLRKIALKIWFDATHSGLFAKDKVAPWRKIYRRIKAHYTRGEFRGVFINGRWV